MRILYLCSDVGVPVLGCKGAAVHVRELVAAFSRAGHQVVLAAQVLNKSPWEKPAALEATPLSLRPGSCTAEVAEALKGFNATIGVENSLPGEVRRILLHALVGIDADGASMGEPEGTRRLHPFIDEV